MTDQDIGSATNQSDLADWYHRVPKVELHFHLEGSIPIEALWELVQKYGGAPEAPNVEALKEFFTFRDFQRFIELWVWKNQFIREYEDFKFFSAAIASHLKAQNIRYVEAFYSPSRFKPMGLETGLVTEAIRSGLDSVEGVEVALVPDMVRDLGAENAAANLEEVAELRHTGVVGIGLGGSERNFPPEIYTDVYARARKLDLRVTAHAGEAAGADSVWGAIRSLEVERIGHGTRAHEDEKLIDFLVESQLPLEMCPLSNVATGVVSSISQHPIRDYFNRGLMVSVNTDDPGMFGNSMQREFIALEKELGFTPDEIRKLILNGVESSWLSPTRKRELADSFESDPSWQE